MQNIGLKIYGKGGLIELANNNQVSVDEIIISAFIQGFTIFEVEATR